MFHRNLLLNENHPLHNRALHINGVLQGIEKPDIESKKVDIDIVKADIETDIKSSRASELLKEMLDHGIIEPVSGHGKGKYCFCR